MATNLFRFNIVDEAGAASFTGPAHGLKVLAAACSHGARSIPQLLEFARNYDADWIQSVRTGLMVFDEHNIDEVATGYKPLITDASDVGHPPFRVIDAVTRSRSMQPAQLGLVILNLRRQRIIQIQNNYAELHRKGRGRIRSRGVPTRSLFHYELPESWSIVP